MEGVVDQGLVVGPGVVVPNDLAQGLAAVLIGEGLRGGVVGGIEPTGKDYQAQAIDSGTGRASASGDLPHEETFQSMAKTLGAALGVSRTRLDEAITGGRVIESALAG